MIPPINPAQEIITVRVLDFPKDKVFEAWSDPDQLKIWWGPKGFTNNFETFDFQPGGRWKFVMHGPEKGNYKNEAEFIAIAEPDLIYWKRISQPLFRVCATFEDAGNQSTKLTFRMMFDSVEECEKLKPYVVDKNEENFDKLNDLLKSLYSVKETKKVK